MFIVMINPLVTNGLSHRYLLGESTFILRESGELFNFLFTFFDDFFQSKQNSPGSAASHLEL